MRIVWVRIQSDFRFGFLDIIIVYWIIGIHISKLRMLALDLLCEKIYLTIVRNRSSFWESGVF